MSVALALSKCPPDTSVECNITHFVLVHWFEGFVDRALDAKKQELGTTGELSKNVFKRTVMTANMEAVTKLRDLFIGDTTADDTCADAFRDDAKSEKFVNKSQLDALVKMFERRQNVTRFTFCVDCGRYMTGETTKQKGPGVIARKRVEAVKHGAYIMFRAVLDNSDLVETKFLAVVEKPYRPGQASSANGNDVDGFCFFDRSRDMTEFELMCLRRWSAAMLGDDERAIQKFWNPVVV